MRTIMLQVTLGAVLFASGAAVAGAPVGVFSRAKGKFSTMFNQLKYDPSDACYKPSRPFSDDEFARSAYIRSAKEYIGCLEEAARADQNYAAEVINDGYAEAADSFIAEFKRGY